MQAQVTTHEDDLAMVLAKIASEKQSKLSAAVMHRAVEQERLMTTFSRLALALENVASEIERKAGELRQELNGLCAPQIDEIDFDQQMDAFEQQIRALVLAMLKPH